MFQIQLELLWLSFLEFVILFLQLKFFLSLLFFWRQLFYRPYEVFHKSLVIKSEFILRFQPLEFLFQRELSRNKRSSWRLKMNQWSLLQWYKTIVVLGKCCFLPHTLSKTSPRASSTSLSGSLGSTATPTPSRCRRPATLSIQKRQDPPPKLLRAQLQLWN